MEFVQKITPPDFRAKNFTPSFSPNFNSFSKKKHKKMSDNGEIYTAGSDGMDKYHLWQHSQIFPTRPSWSKVALVDVRGQMFLVANIMEC